MSPKRSTFGSRVTKSKPGVTPQIRKVLKPINSAMGGRGVEPTLFTTNGFNKVQFKSKNFEETNKKLRILFDTCKLTANKATMASRVTRRTTTNNTIGFGNYKGNSGPVTPQ